MPAKRKYECHVCGRKEGSTKDRCGSDDGSPLGQVEKCGTCGRRACPDCMHEADCCFADADGHQDDSTWAPPDWRLAEPPNGTPSLNGQLFYQRG